MSTSTSSKGGYGGGCSNPYNPPTNNPYIGPPWGPYVPHYPFVTAPYPDWVLDQWWNGGFGPYTPSNPGGVPPVHAPNQKSIIKNTAIPPYEAEVELAKNYFNFWQIGSVGTDEEKVNLIRWWKSEVFEPLNRPFRGFFGPIFDDNKSLKGFWFQPTKLKVEVCTFKNNGTIDVKWKTRDSANWP